MAEPVFEAAPAKVNLTLHVTGQRDDGYHLLHSLIVFPKVADRLHACQSDTLSLEIIGPFADQLTTGSDNLILRAANLINPGKGAAITLEKNLPIAAGIGGGSADAAAAIRLLARLWAVPLPTPRDLLCLGADVPTCLGSKPVIMAGIGELLTDVKSLPNCGILLINPGVQVSTPEVFRALKCKENSEMTTCPASMGNAADLVGWLAMQRNDLQECAINMAPVIGTVLQEISGTENCLLARMSGSGATCFGLYSTLEQAQSACAELTKTHPNWWAVASEL